MSLNQVGVQYELSIFPAADSAGTYTQRKQLVSVKKTISNARTSLIHLLSSIVRENYEDLFSLDLRMKKLGRELSRVRGEQAILLKEEINTVETQQAKISMIVVVFTAMTVEAYIYDYAARHFGDAFVKDHLDKLDTVSKWIIIPELVTGREMPRQDRWHAFLKKLIGKRNSLIHHKSSNVPPSAQDMKRYLEKLQINENELVEIAKQSVPLLNKLADTITRIDPEETPWVKSYLT